MSAWISLHTNAISKANGYTRYWCRAFRTDDDSGFVCASRISSANGSMGVRSGGDIG